MISLAPLPLTKTNGPAGVGVLTTWPGLKGRYLQCSLHGAMLRVSGDQRWYRCPTCNIGYEMTVSGADAIDWDAIQAEVDRVRTQSKGLTEWSIEARVGHAVGRAIVEQLEKQ